MELIAIEVEQSGKCFYLTKMPAKALLDSNKIVADIWGPENPDGYQREPNMLRASKFSKYLKTKVAPAPQALLFSIREKVLFKDGVLIIPETAKIYEVDGQHRLEGIRMLVSQNPSFENLEFGVVFITPANWVGIKNPKFQEALQFQTINKTQKSVRTDLTERFLSKLVEQYKDDKELLGELPSEITRGFEYVPKAIEVTEKLNFMAGPWKEKIQFPNQRKGISIVTQKSFTDSLRPIVTNETLRLKYQSIDTLAELLNRYWRAIQLKCPEAFEDPQEYLIQKTTGVFVLNSFFVSVLTQIYYKAVNEEITVEKFKDALDNVSLINSKSWHRKGKIGEKGTNRKSFSLIRELIEDELEKKLREKAFAKYGLKKGSISKAVEIALEQWIK